MSSQKQVRSRHKIAKKPHPAPHNRTFSFGQQAFADMPV